MINHLNHKLHYVSLHIWKAGIVATLCYTIFRLGWSYTLIYCCILYCSLNVQLSEFGHIQNLEHDSYMHINVYHRYQTKQL